MDTHPTAILMADRIGDSATTEEIMDQTPMPGTRLKLKDMIASDVLQKLVSLNGDPLDPLISHVEELTKQVSLLIAENASLEATVDDLRSQLRSQPNGAFHKPANTDGSYTMEQFLSLLTIKRRRSYGWKTDYIFASHSTDRCKPATNLDVQKWQATNKVPDWAVAQIDGLVFPARIGTGSPAWSDANEAFLVAIYLENPNQSNVDLAQRCEAHFNRPVNENGIKGAIDRARRRGELPKKRPSRAK